MGKLLLDIQGEDRWVEFDDEYSFKDFTNQDMSECDLNGKTIYSSSFYHETPGTPTFSSTMTGAAFIKCNLDNVIVPEGNSVIECSERCFKAHTDGRDWEVDEYGQFVCALGEQPSIQYQVTKYAKDTFNWVYDKVFG